MGKMNEWNEMAKAEFLYTGKYAYSHHAQMSLTFLSKLLWLKNIMIGLGLVLW